MNWTEEDLALLCSNPNIMVLLQGGAGSVVENSLSTDARKKTSPKYHNKKVYLYQNGMTSSKKDERLGILVQIYDSEKEYLRHCELTLLEQIGCISELRRQVPIKIQDDFVYRGNKVKEISYKADFVYVENSDRTCIVVEDVKGYDEKRGKYLTTKDFDLKWKLLKFKYPQYNFQIV